MAVTPTVSIEGVGTAVVKSLSVMQQLNAPGHIHAVLAPDIAEATIEALSGAGSLICTAGFNGSSASRCVVRYPDYALALPTELIIDEDDIWEGYKYTGVDRLITHNANIKDVVTEIFEELPGIAGMPTRAELAFVGVTGYSAVPVSDDLNAVMLETAVATLARIVGAATNPEFGFYFADAGGTRPTCYIGVPGPGGGYTFSGALLDNNVHVRPDHRATYSQFAIVGGSSTHGLPQGFQITGAATDGHTFLVAGKVDDNLGGIYGLSNLNFEPRSPVNLGITDLFTSPANGMLLASTAHGAYAGVLIGNLDTWQVIGKYGGPCQSICAGGSNVYMVVADVNAGINGLYGCVQAADGSFGPILPPQLGRNHDGWSNLYSQDLLCCAATTTHLFYVLAGDPTNVWLYRAGGAHQQASGGPSGKFPIVKLVGTPDLIYILTSGPAGGLFSLDPTSLLIQPVDMPSVVDTNGNTITIGSVTNVVVTQTGATWFCTDQGLVVGNALYLVGTRVDYAALGVNYGASGPVGGTMYVTDGTRIFDSNSGGINWRDILNQPVTPHAALPNAPETTTAGWRARTSASDGNRYYRYIQAGPPYSSYGNLLISDAPSIQAGGILTPLEASQFLVRVTERLAAQYRKPIATYELPGIVQDEDSALLNLKPTNIVNFRYHRAACPPGDPGVSYGKSGLYVIQHTISVDHEPFATTHTVAASSMCQQPYTAEEIAKATLYLFAQQARSK